MKVLRVTVEQEHIDMGSRGDYRRCPLARAIKETAPTCQSVGPMVMASRQWATQWREGDICVLPSEVAALAEGYDVGGELLPFSFPCLAPDYALSKADPKKVGEAWGYYRLAEPEK